MLAEKPSCMMGSKMATAIKITNAMANSAIVATAAQAKPFQKGDLVVYPACGVGTVDRVGPEEVGGHTVNLVRIYFSENGMTLRIPVAKARAVGLRRLATREAFEKILLILQGRPRVNGSSGRDVLRSASSRSTRVTSPRLLRLFAICGLAPTAPGPASASAICSRRRSIVSLLSSPRCRRQTKQRP